MGDTQDASRWERVKAVFSEALERDGADRAAYLERATAGDAELRREVQSLLAEHDEDRGLMASPTLWTQTPDDASGSSPSAHVPLPEHFGRYHIETRLGAGGMGEVYRAHDPQLDRPVALKVLPAALANRPERRARLLHEARAAARLNHPHIATIHEIDTADGRDYIALEYIAGRSLAALLSERELTPEQLVDIALPLARAVSFAHEHGVIHRDVKPANVMLTEDGQPKLVDFGLAMQVNADDDTNTSDGAVFGTPGAMSPEQAQGQPVDHRSDVFSFGSLLYEMACRRPAFRGETPMGTMDAVIQDDPRPLLQLRPELPPALVAIIERALRKPPDKRYQHMSELAADLADFKRQTESGLLPRRPAAAARSSRVVLGMLAGLGLALLVWWMNHTGDGAPSQPPSAATVAVVCLDNLDDPADSDHLAGMLARRLTAELSHADGLNVLSQQRLFDVARQLGRPDGTIDRSVATEVARHAAVDTMILGEVSRVGPRLMVTIELVETATGRVLGSHEASGEQPDDVFRMAAVLGRQVRLTLSAPELSAAERAALDQQLTSSIEAFAAFVDGEHALRVNDVDAAAAAYERAAELDPAFALAHYRHAMALIWLGDYSAVRTAIDRTYAFSDNLPADLRRILDATRPVALEDETRDALPFLLQVVEDDPFQRDALYMLGEIYTHSGTRNDANRAAAIYTQLLQLNPGFSLVYEHRLSADLRLGRFDSARESLDAWRADSPHQMPALEGELALWEGRFATARELLGERLDLDMLSGTTTPLIDTLLAQSVDDIVASLDEAQGIHRVLELDQAGNALVLHGRFDDAAELYRRAIDVEIIVSRDGFGTNPRNASRHRLAALHALRGDIDRARQLADEALAIQADSFRCLYQALRFALLVDDTDAAQQHLAQLTDLAARGWSPTGSLYRDAAQAEFDLHAGRALAARDTLMSLVAAGRQTEDWRAFGDSIGPLMRAALARACLDSADTAGAAAALDGLLESGVERVRQPIAWVLALGQRGQLALDAGQPAAGNAWLTRFVDHWGRTDLPAVTAARQRLP